MTRSTPLRTAEETPVAGKDWTVEQYHVEPSKNQWPTTRSSLSKSSARRAAVRGFAS
jgi:hypothetical protein